MNIIETMIRSAARCGMTDGTVMVIEFISGFELFNTRPYHSYETWAQGWRVHGLGVFVEREDLAEAIATWTGTVKRKREGVPVPSYHNQATFKRDGAPYRTPETLPDWIVNNRDESEESERPATAIEQLLAPLPAHLEASRGPGQEDPFAL